VAARPQPSGFLEAGVDDVVVTESHGSMRNLLLEQLDPRVPMITGRHKRYAMADGMRQEHAALPAAG
jgi:D-amino peptidase